jgi:hypothetical protein
MIDFAIKSNQNLPYKKDNSYLNSAQKYFVSDELLFS